MSRLNLVSYGDDVELDAIRCTITCFESVRGLDDLESLLRDRAQRDERIDVVDVIGHSRAHGFLVMGTWVIDDSPQTGAAFSEVLRPSLRRLGVRTVRLLGCSTATSERGRSALRRIAQVTGCSVHGTRRYISKHDYDATGFSSEEALLDADGARPVADPVGFLPSGASVGDLSSRGLAPGPGPRCSQPLLPVNEEVAVAIMQFVDGSRSWLLPGLLAEAASIVLWSRNNSLHRIEVLLDCHVVRAYADGASDDHGRLYRVRDPDGLRRYLAAITRPRNESQDRRT